MFRYLFGKTDLKYFSNLFIKYELSVTTSVCLLGCFVVLLSVRRPGVGPSLCRICGGKSGIGARFPPSEYFSSSLSVKFHQCSLHFHSAVIHLCNLRNWHSFQYFFLFHVIKKIFFFVHFRQDGKFPVEVLNLVI